MVLITDIIQACVACGVLSACAIVAGGHRRKLRAQAQQLVLTCAFFDSEGRIMVTPHALLPSRKIVDRYIGRVCRFSMILGAVFWPPLTSNIFSSDI